MLQPQLIWTLYSWLHKLIYPKQHYIFCGCDTILVAHWERLFSYNKPSRLHHTQITLSTAVIPVSDITTVWPQHLKEGEKSLNMPQTEKKLPHSSIIYLSGPDVMPICRLRGWCEVRVNIFVTGAVSTFLIDLAGL